MSLFAFELGRLKDLSLAELSSIFGEKSIVSVIRDYAILDLNKDVIVDRKLQNRLGGTIKIVQILKQIPQAPKAPKELESVISESLEQILEEHLADHTPSGKFHFAISTINIAGNSKIFLKFLLNFCKDYLKSQKVSSRFVNKPWENPTSAQIYKSKTLEKGLDLSVIGTNIEGNETIYLGKTVTIQDIDLYSIRDYEKPFRDSRMGMLPPKLAQIMINLAGPDTKTIYDPFCGSGTILMEGLLQRKAVYGSDIDERAVEGTKTNLNWIIENTSTSTDSTKSKHDSDHTAGTPSQEPKDVYEVFQKDVTTLKQADYPKNLDAIVAETYLGPSQSRVPPQEEQSKIFKNLAALHSVWLKTIPKNTKVVLAIPAFRLASGKYNHFEAFFDLATDAGLKILNRSSSSKPLIYDRDDQIVAREIVMMEK